MTEKEFKLFAEVYSIDDSPNFEREYFVPLLEENIESKAKLIGVESETLMADLKPIRRKLFEIRAKRIRPLTDKKILTSWNGMMIRGFADAGRILKEENHLAVAMKAADFILAKMIDDEGRLVRTYTDGQAKLNAYLPDYSCLIDGLIAIHRATQDKKWLDAAQKLQEKQDELFWDEAGGGYFYTSNDHESLLARAKKVNDGAVPAGNSVSATNLVYLARALNNPDYLKKAERTAATASALLAQYPISSPRLMVAVRMLAESRTDE